MKKIKKILIANRSEIVIRISQTCKKLGIETVGIYSDLDYNSKFISEVDLAVPLDGIYNYDTYLNIEKIINIALKYKVDAIHPGYGFLSENPDFAKKVEEAGIIFIGPKYQSMLKLGEKINAKLIANKAAINVVPGFIGSIDLNNQSQINGIVKDIGFPLIIKASAGGGGKGMRIVYNKENLIENLSLVRNEAISNFKNPDIFIEKYIEDPKHIEVQVLADKFGNVITLGERDCSVQRLNQKIIEEAPSSISLKTKEKMYNQAKQLILAAEYYSAATVEYIVDKDENFYFLEVNTRLQVEHRVTEFITGIDIVEQMIYIAEDQKLKYDQKDILFTGHSIECRIYAENPSENFLPSAGMINEYQIPQEDSTTIIDTSIINGSIVSQFYDPMIAKIITYGDSREDSISKMNKALANFYIEGVNTNILFLEAILRSSRFLHEYFSTKFIQKEYPKGFKSFEIKDNTRLSFICVSIFIYLKNEYRYFNDKDLSINDFILKNDQYRFLSVIFDQEKYHIKVISLTNDNILLIEYNNLIITFESNYKFGDKYFNAILNNNIQFIFKYFPKKDKFILKSNGASQLVYVLKSDHLPLLNYQNISDDIEKSLELKATMSGMVKSINVDNDSVVLKGQKLFSIEAMKMENNIFSEFDSKVKKIHKKVGDIVQAGELILEFIE